MDIMAGISILIIGVAVIIGILRGLISKFKNKKNELNQFYIKQVKAVMITLIVIEFVLVMIMFLTEMGF